MTTRRLPPTPSPQTALRGLRAMLRQGHPLAALQVFHAELGDVFGVQLPNFAPVFLVGPQAARFVLVQAQDDLRWRNEADPVTDLLRHGVLVEDGEAHAALRRQLNPALHRRQLTAYAAAMWAAARQVTAAWPDGGTVDMLVEMRKIALLALLRTLYGVDFTPQLERLWSAVLGCIRYISPGAWMFAPGLPRPGYARHIARLDAYLYAIIAERRQRRATGEPLDMLGMLVCSELDDAAVRDQLLTMLIAGHDTVTALLAWALHLLGAHPAERAAVREEVDAALAPEEDAALATLTGLERLGDVIREALRLYPPIHLGSRVAAADLEYAGYTLPRGTRVVYSIYLTGRHPAWWPEPERFWPGRFRAGSPPPYTWLAFGGGPRNCIGAAYGQAEARLVLAHVLRSFELRPVGPRVHPHMGATLEPRPGVWMQVRRRG